MSLVALNRHLSLKENSPLLLIVDTLGQLGRFLLEEIISRFGGPVIWLSYEHPVQPKGATLFLYCSGVALPKIEKFVQENSGSRKLLVVLDSLNYVLPDEVAQLVSCIALPQNSVVAGFHQSCPQAFSTGYPQPLTLLSYIALAIYQVEPLRVEDEEAYENSVSNFVFPVNQSLNGPVFKLTFTARRKSGKSLVHRFIVDTEKHEIDIFHEKKDDDEEQLMDGLTTFNLNTSSKQKLAKEQVELPFMEAQQELGKLGGAIVYQFEKDDDYDEEDPYEDPF